MVHYQQMPAPLSTLFLVYQEARARVISLNRAVPELHFTRLDTVLDNVVLVDVAQLTATERSFLKISPSYPSEVVWIANTPEKDWEILWQWRPPLRVAEFTFYARGLGPKAPAEKAGSTGNHARLDPNRNRELIRMSYVIQDVHVTPDDWIEWLDRDAKPRQWREVIGFLGFLGKLEFWNPIVHSLLEAKPCIPPRTV
jgi:hypothetical protein